MANAYPYNCDDPDEYDLNRAFAKDIADHDAAAADRICQKTRSVIEESPEDFYVRYAELVDDIVIALEALEAATQERLKTVRGE